MPFHGFNIVTKKKEKRKKKREKRKEKQETRNKKHGFCNTE